MNLAVQNTIESLETLKSEVIGIFKIGENFELVIDFDKDTNTIDTVYVTQFGALQCNYNIPIKHIGQFKLFPNDRFMHQMLNNPYEWNEFINSFK